MIEILVVNIILERIVQHDLPRRKSKFHAKKLDNAPG